jgi:hypothetical protein
MEKDTTEDISWAKGNNTMKSRFSFGAEMYN